jgi:hypothetical protein
MFKSKSEFLKKIEHKPRFCGRYTNPHNAFTGPFGLYFRRYIEFMRTSTLVDRRSDIGKIRIIQEFLARESVRYIDSISPALVDEFTTAIFAGEKSKTARNYIGLLKSVLNKAVEWELIDHNPIVNVKSLKVVKAFHPFSKKTGHERNST